ncbi:malto-oligosyltrehalose synthase [Geomesophilobacter sediminis]|uniref:Malto-oligosyltrehalose synthase n=1 Tax=Geomesophilobacter sediminis TaxID=2798584 RepID=A0A8J7M306_9BACT|nr:malto-oligosyltrehalose synthase [Geomesophilobacter sediminis]MBJ6727804.1 malto-oligosyltrehalose synthase [Geomesophilobacter sediminis]
MDQEALPGTRIPTATYRLQFNSGFRFSQAQEIVSYLHDLGISDLYCSSYVAAKEGSIHGYDVVNQTVFNREIGTEEDFARLSGELEGRGMGQILDFVPNHMCVESPDNIWWMDVLENGPSSLYATFFDIDWQPVKKELTDKVLLPLLGDQYGRVLERGELSLLYKDGAFFVNAASLDIPLDPKSCLLILTHRLDTLKEQFAPEDPTLTELLSIVTALQHLPGFTERDPEKQQERHREKEIIKKRLAQLCQDAPPIRSFLEENLAEFNGVKGEPRSFDRLDALLLEQPYRLSYWRVATEEINYRRFFDINSLAAIRMEDKAVFDKTHVLLFRLIREGKVTGIRIDHVDGLYDPYRYLHALQKGCLGQRLPGLPAPEEPEWAERVSAEYDIRLAGNPAFRPFYIVCEKILMKGEQLPEEWPVYGTTGYDFMNQLNGIFIDSENARAFDRIYYRFVRGTEEFQEVMYRKKKLVMEVSLSGEANMLGHQLNNISERDRLTRDFTLNSLTRAIIEVIACFPVYRTYLNSGEVRDKDNQYIESAVSKARRKNPAMNASIFDFLRSVLLLKYPDYASEEDRRNWFNFAMRFQQITGPVMAKGLEDTTFYVYNRLLSLNEVGGAPGRFGTTREAFHGQNLERVKNFPHTLLATATHDTKRGEDVRPRIDALSELPDRWHRALVRWRAVNRKKGGSFENQPVPDGNEEYLFYQTLLGAWPHGEIDPQTYDTFCGRIREYLIKALREAKVNTSWVSPNQGYEEAVLAFVNEVLAPDPDNVFLKEFAPLQREVAHYGMFSSLSQVLLKMTSPGVPDFYQGCELWDLSLVDPDNRRQVDYAARVRALSRLKEREAQVGARELFRELMEERENGMIKLYLIYRCLNFRRGQAELFRDGDYHPLEARGAKARHVVSFARGAGRKRVIVAAPRLVATLLGRPDRLPVGDEVWGDTFLPLPHGIGARYRNVLTDEELLAEERHGALGMPLGHLFQELPVAVLFNEP